MEKKLVPKLRFPEFSGEWEEKKLGDIGSTFTGLSGKTKEDFGKGDAEFVTYLNVFNNPIADIKLTENVEIDKNQYEIKYGDIFFTTSSETPEEVGMSSVWLDNRDNVYLNSFCFGLRPKRKVNPLFMAYALRSTPIRKQFIILAQGISRYNISKIKSMDIEIRLPSNSEQEKIANFFKLIDKKIEKQEEKIASIEEYKKGMMQKLFPKKGENVPELRFKGFTAPWEQRKFEDVFVKLQNNSLSRAQLNYEEGIANNVHYGDILIKFGECLDVKKEQLPYINNDILIDNYRASFLNNGDVIFADAAEDETVGKCSEIRGLTTQVVISGLHTIPCRPIQKFASGYLGYYLNSNAYHNQLLPLMQGTKVSSISRSSLNETYVIYPKSKEEQEKIGTFFINLDNLIILHQRKFEELKELKKGFMQKMFI